MTVIALRKPVVHRPEPTWLAALQQHVAQDWRADEWQPVDWVFVGHPENPQTRVFRCGTTDCPYLTQSPNGLPCNSCRDLIKESDGNAQEFQRRFEMLRYTPRLQYGKPKERCRVAHEGDRCQRGAWAQGVCDAHYSQWRNTYLKRGMSLNQVLSAGIARPLAALSECRVRSCVRDRGPGPLGLCLTHKEGYRSKIAQAAREGRQVSVEEYAATAGPVKARGNFCFLALSETVRWELLYALQMDDQAGIVLDPMVVNHAAGRLEGEASLLADGFIERALDGIKKHTSLPSWLRRAVKHVRLLHAMAAEVDVTADDVWDSMLVGLQTQSHHQGKANPLYRERYAGRRLPIDFRPIRQEWLRELVKQWARDMRPTTFKILQAITAFTVLSQALASRARGDDPSTAGIRDITRAVTLLAKVTNDDGELLSASTRSARVGAIRGCLGYLRSAGLMNHVPDGFMVTAEHRIKRNEAADESGRALPDRAMAVIMANLEKVAPRAAQTGSLMSLETLTRMHQTSMRVLIDTGRRPYEVCALQVGCVTGKEVGGTVEYTLTWTNEKGKRDGRRLPITVETAQIILDWEKERRSLDLPAKYRQWLFPTPSVGRSDAARHLTVAAMGHALDRLLSAIPPLESDMPDRAVNGYLPYAGEVGLYSFRHSYCQRHADMGVPIDTLCELMDHKSPRTTMVYYHVSAQRKREAIKAVSGFTVNRHGESAPMSSVAAYEVGSVAVPFGNCNEPSNVKAGGQACPIRFRCAGCDHFRPDPSYLPALEQHLVDLRANLALAEATGFAADWVTFEMRQEIDAYVKIVRSMKKRLTALDGEEREALDDASVALRRLRGHRPVLQLTVMRAEGR